MRSTRGRRGKEIAMKQQIAATLVAALSLAATAHAQKQVHAQTIPPQPPEPVPIYFAPPPPLLTSVPREKAVFVYEQRPAAQGTALIPLEQAQAILERFRTNYVRLENPRILLLINRPLLAGPGALKVAGRTETITTTGPGTNGADASRQTVVQNHLQPQERAELTVADRQSIRDIERLFGRPLRFAGATLVDESIAHLLPGNRPPGELAGAEAPPDREALGRLADVVVEILVTTRNVTTTEVGGDRTYTVPDIQATAIRLRDARVIGQATAAEVLGRGPSLGYTARNFTVPDITEATALALMEDICQAQVPRN